MARRAPVAGHPSAPLSAPTPSKYVAKGPGRDSEAPTWSENHRSVEGKQLVFTSLYSELDSEVT